MQSPSRKGRRKKRLTSERVRNLNTEIRREEEEQTQTTEPTAATPNNGRYGLSSVGRRFP